MLFLLLAAQIFLPEYPAQIVRVIDGDTVVTHVYPWPGMIVETRIRVRGIDTPEIRGKCEEEKTKARDAKRMTAKLLPSGTKVELRNIKQDKYAGRHDADVILSDGRSLADALIAAGLARPYDGGKRPDWCNVK